MLKTMKYIDTQLIEIMYALENEDYDRAKELLGRLSQAVDAEIDNYDE